MESKKNKKQAEEPKPEIDLKDLEPEKDAKGGATASGGTVIQQERSSSFFHS